jgi:tetratricopeptide (TPR) repeat protein
MYVAYNRFYPPELATVEARNASPDRSHNETFDTLAITGLAGFLAWQALYLTIIHFAFRRLGVVRSRRDTWALMGLWAGGAMLAALIAIIFADLIYIGVAVPTGVILGVVAYLIYYALFGRRKDDPDVDEARPFAAERLLMNALAAAVLAHYVEIHFGIAISATRLYFFVYGALIFVIGYRLRQTAVEPDEAVAPTSIPARPDKRRRRAAITQVDSKPKAGWNRLAGPALLLVLMIGLLGFGFITYALPPDKVITGPADLSTVEIFRQSLLQNARKDFADWPFVFSMFVLSWLLGWLIFLSEMIKHGEIQLPEPGGGLPDSRRYLAAGVLVTLAIFGAAFHFLIPPATTTAALGHSVALIGALACASVAALFLLNRPIARMLGGASAALLIILAVAVAIAGGFAPALVMSAGGALVAWLLWDGRWRGSLLSLAGVILASLAGGFLFIFLHAANYRSLLFFQAGASDSSTANRALEAARAGILVSLLFAAVFLIIFLLAFALSWPALFSGRRPRAGANAALSFGGLVVALIAAFFLIAQTNVRSIQADMIYKRAKPYDDQATQAMEAEPAARRAAWDTAIAIYQAAVDLVPREDFYYLFLGRAYLERAGLTEDAAERAALLTEAESLLLRAQDINPLNTDHTANLARLNTRWYVAVEDEAEKEERLGLAQRYYEDALVLSPQNSIIRNELARLILDLRGDCDRALAFYDESASIDPFYSLTQLGRADAYIACAGGREDAERDQFYRTAAGALEGALETDPANIRAWIQLAEIYRQLGEYERALVAVEGARAQNDPVVFPTAEIDFLAAQIVGGLGNTAEARALAERALETAGTETAAQIEAFLRELGGG